MAPPVCHLGYPREQLSEILGDRLEHFEQWMFGQTQAICEGRQYDHSRREYLPTNCGPHGVVTYRWDLVNYLSGGEIDD